MAATKTAKSAQSIAGYSTEDRIPATRYKQGKRTVYGTYLTPGEIVGLIPKPNPEASNPGNRKIRPKHASDFADYYLERERWVSPGVILRAPDVFAFESDEGNPFGTLSLPRRLQAEISILDAQHRILGFHLALERIQKRIADAKSFRAKAIKQEQGDVGAAVVREAEAAVAKAEALLDRFYQERVSVEIHVTDDLNEYRQMFFDIAENALGITAAVRARFDSTKVVNRALAPVMDHPLLAGRVDIENDRIGSTSPFLVSAKHVVDIIRSVVVGADGRVGKVMERDLSDLAVSQKAIAFLDLAVESFAPYQALIAGQVMPETLRATGMLGSPAAMRMLASLYHDLRSDEHGWDDEMVGNFFKALAPHMNDRAHVDSIWIEHMPQVDSKGRPLEPFRLDAYGPDVRRQNIASAVDTLVEWAVLGKKGAPWVWQKPKAAPEPEPTEDELVLQAQIEADPELGRLLEEREEAEAKMVKAGKVKK